MNNLTINPLNMNANNPKIPNNKKNTYIVDGAIVIGTGGMALGGTSIYTKTVFQPKFNKKVIEFRDKFSKLLTKRTEEYKNNPKALKYLLEEYNEAIEKIDNMEKNIVKNSKKIKAKSTLAGLTIGALIIFIKHQLSKRNKQPK